MALACLGFFVFQTGSIPYQSRRQTQTWHHPHNPVIGGSLPPSQYTGREPDTLSIRAELRPEITGGDRSLNLIRQMAASGQAFPLILGSGSVLGSFVILSIQSEHQQLMHDGQARAISLTLELKKTSDQAIGIEGQALLDAAGLIRTVAGI